MPLRQLIPFLILVFVFAIAGTWLALQLFGNQNAEGSSNVPRLITVEVIVTATPDPNATSNVVIVTPTLQPGQIPLPTDIALNDPTAEAGATIVAQALGQQTPGAANPATTNNAATTNPTAPGTALPENCIVHTLQEGEFPSLIAQEYGADLFRLMAINNLNEENASLLQIGDELIVPLEGCNIEIPPTATFTVTPSETPENSPTPTPTEAQSPTPTPAISPTPTATPTLTPTPTITLAPTAVDAQIEIVEIIAPGDVTAEGVFIRNQGNTVDITGWTLQDDDGNVFTFPEQLFFENGGLTVYTRAGENTPVARYWGLDTAVWQAGDVLTLLDVRGEVQAVTRINAALALD